MLHQLLLAVLCAVTREHFAKADSIGHAEECPVRPSLLQTQQISQPIYERDLLEDPNAPAAIPPDAEIEAPEDPSLMEMSSSKVPLSAPVDRMPMRAAPPLPQWLRDDAQRYAEDAGAPPGGEDFLPVKYRSNDAAPEPVQEPAKHAARSFEPSHAAKEAPGLAEVAAMEAKRAYRTELAAMEAKRSYNRQMAAWEAKVQAEEAKADAEAKAKAKAETEKAKAETEKARAEAEAAALRLQMQSEEQARHRAETQLAAEASRLREEIQAKNRAEADAEAEAATLREHVRAKEAEELQGESVTKHEVTNLEAEFKNQEKEVKPQEGCDPTMSPCDKILPKEAVSVEDCDPTMSVPCDKMFPKPLPVKVKEEKEIEKPKGPVELGHCHPQCMWKCESPKCDEICKPKCKPPKCETRCFSASVKGCAMECNQPHCAVMCPERMCPSKESPCTACQTTCSEPVCKLKCPHRQACKNVCEQPDCQWSCKAPLRCPPPKCKMWCETPKSCKGSTHAKLPPLKLGETVVKDFSAPVKDTKPCGDSPCVDSHFKALEEEMSKAPERSTMRVPTVTAVDSNVQAEGTRLMGRPRLRHQMVDMPML